MIFFTPGRNAHLLDSNFVFVIKTHDKIFVIWWRYTHTLWDDIFLVPNCDVCVLLIIGGLTGQVRVKCVEVL